MGHEAIVKLLIGLKHLLFKLSIDFFRLLTRKNIPGAGADPTLTDDDMKTPMHKCAERDQFACAEIMLHYMPGPNLMTLKDKRGRTAMDLVPTSLSRWKDLLEE